MLCAQGDSPVLRIKGGDRRAGRDEAPPQAGQAGDRAGADRG